MKAISARDADALYQRGGTDLLSALDTQRVALEVGDQRAQAATAVAVGMVSLYRAIGGGWRDEVDARLDVRAVRVAP